MNKVDIQIKDGEIHEKQHLYHENRRILKHADDSDNHKKKLSVKNYPEIIGIIGCGSGGVVCMPHHKPNDCEKYGGSENVMYGVVFWDENNTKNPY